MIRREGQDISQEPHAILIRRQLKARARLLAPIDPRPELWAELMTSLAGRPAEQVLELEALWQN